MNTLRFKYILGYILLVTIFFLVSHHRKEQTIQSYVESRNSIIQANFKTTSKNFEKLSKAFFDTIINTQEIIDIFKHSEVSSPNTQNILRNQLFEKLSHSYKHMKEYNVVQLHFHTHDGKSFLRFHQKDKYGDDLTTIRPGIEYVMNNHKPYYGFEIGKYKSGWRFIYPIFDSLNYIGSVEISFSCLAFVKVFEESFHDKNNILVNKSLATESSTKESLQNYIQSPFENFFYEKEIISDFGKNFHPSNLQKSTVDEVTNIKYKKIFSLYDSKADKVFTIVPIFSDFEKKLQAIFIAKSDTKLINETITNYQINSFIVVLLISFIFAFIYSNHKKQVTLKHIIDQAHTGIGIISVKGRFLKVNNAYCNILGYDKIEFLHMNCMDLTASHQVKETAKLLQQISYKENIVKIPKQCKTKDGNLINVELSLSLLPSKQEILVVMNSIEDKIQLRDLNFNLAMKVQEGIQEIQAKDQIVLQQSKTAAMGEMIDAIAHQWKNPLGLIKMNTDIIKLMLTDEIKADKDEIIESLDKSMKHINHLNDTLDEFRSFFRPDKPKETINLLDLVNNCLTLMQDELKKHSIEIKVCIDQHIDIEVIRNEFIHVLINLLNNAKDALVENKIDQKQITIHSISCCEGKIAIEVCDNAGGIPENILEKIFESNFTTKKQGKGTGVGLYLSKQIIQKIGGTITASNKNNGACFTVIL